jgi:hypothetical protein
MLYAITHLLEAKDRYPFFNVDGTISNCTHDGYDSNNKSLLRIGISSLILLQGKITEFLILSMVT